MDKLYLILPVVFFLGYFFGRWTCGRNTKNESGFIVTILTFILLNFIHSIVDGTLLRSLTFDLYTLGIIGGHEAIRQPLLYFIYFTATVPFPMPLWQKIPLGLLAVTGTWILGLGIGSQLTINTKYLPHNEIAFCIYAFFGGDIFHHFLDYLIYKSNKGTKNKPSLH